MRFVLLLSLLLPSLAQAADASVMFDVGRWIMEQQRDFHRELARLVKLLAKEGNSALMVSLIVASFLYGVFHAAGPGHGKAVIASYLLATKAPLRKGVQLAFISAMLQGLVAITLVWLMAKVLGIAGQITETTQVLERVSYVAIGVMGIWMLWRLAQGKSSCGHDHSNDVAHAQDPHHGCTHDHSHEHHHGCSHDHAHEHHHGCTHDHAHGCQHDHGSTPVVQISNDEQKIAKRSTLAIVSSIGIRPCTGAVLVLLFASSTGILQWGMLATLVMSLGTAITVSALALISVLVRDGSMAMSPSKWRQRVTRALGVVAACALIFISVTMLYSDFQVAGRAF